MKLTSQLLLNFLPETLWTSKELIDRLNQAGHEASIMAGDIIEVTISPNRGDCLSLYGLARDLAAIYDQKFQPPLTAALPKAAKFFNLRLRPEAKKSLLGDGLLLLVDYHSKPSPPIIKEQLALIGLTPKELLIDLTNLVSWEIGLPLHVFDYQKVQEGLTVELSLPDQEIQLLDGSRRRLKAGGLIQSSMLGPTDLAGITGGYSSRVTPITTQVIVQAAVFEPKIIRRTSQELRLTTDASYRFQRGVDPQLINLALGRFLALASQYQANLKATNYQLLAPRKKSSSIAFEPEIIGRLLGRHIQREILGPLKRLGIRVDESSTKLIIPSWRTDLTTSNDLAEEVVRLTGWSSVEPRQLSRQSVKVGQFQQINRLKQQLVALGAVEVVSYSFDRRVSKFHLLNPADSAQPYLRPDHQSGLLNYLAKNPFIKRGLAFEIGQVFAGVSEATALGLIIFGYKKVQSDEIKRQVARQLDRSKLTWQTIVEPELSRLAVKQPNVYFCQLPLSKITLPKGQPLAKSQLPILRPLSKFPPASRDLTLQVSADQSVESILAFIRVEPKLLLVELIDRFRSSALGENQVALTFRLIFQDLTKTLTDSEIDQLQKNSLRRLKQQLEFQVR